MKKSIIISCLIILIVFIIIIGTSYSNKTDNIIQEGKTLYQSIIDDNSIYYNEDNNGLNCNEDYCYFKGNIDNNYLNINDEIWRIVSIDNKHNIKIIKEKEIANTIVNDDYKNHQYLESNIYKVLEEYCSSKLNNIKGNIVEYNYCVSDKEKCLEKEPSYIGLLSRKEYLDTIIDELTYLDFNDNYWLISETYFDKEIDEALFGFVNELGQLDKTFVDVENKVRPVIVLDSSTIAEGNGTKNNPYQIN